MKRFWDKVDKTDDCWLWTGCKNDTGYGNIKETRSRRVLSAHRVSWSIANGKIPEGMFVLHKCDNPPCVNPDHLFIGTSGDNVRDMFRKGRRNMRGENHPHSKLCELDVQIIREIDCPHILIAKFFNVSPNCIGNIRRRETWNHI